MKLNNSALIIRAMKRYSSVLLFLSLLSNFFCNSDSIDQVENSSRSLKNNTSSFIYNMIPEDHNASISPEYSRAINTFSVNLLDIVYTDTQFNRKNIVLSPYSLSRSLAILAEGATGNFFSSRRVFQF
jgi:serine protease inhibitor